MVIGGGEAGARTEAALAADRREEPEQAVVDGHGQVGGHFQVGRGRQNGGAAGGRGAVDLLPGGTDDRGVEGRLSLFGPDPVDAFEAERAEADAVDPVPAGNDLLDLARVEGDEPRGAGSVCGILLGGRAARGEEGETSYEDDTDDGFRHVSPAFSYLVY